MAFKGGISRNEKVSIWSTPRHFKSKTTELKFVLIISGVGFSLSSLSNAHLVYKRKHFPGLVRPALPARWFAAALLTGTISRLLIPDLGWKDISLCNPQSIT
eukprot:NODE_241_length_11910_cov_1.082381.p15 type:complete len:102 gc:universal NODE_241_length_11910_cov_1.082381:8303-7998(-)